MKYIRYISLCILSIVTIILSSCNNTNKSDNIGRLYIATSIEPLAELVRMIADSSTIVQSLLPEGYSAENYDPSTGDLKRVSSADIYFAIGNLGFETSRLNKLKSLNPEVKFVQLSDNFCQHHGFHYEDPHIWTSTRGISSLAKGIATNLANIDTTNRYLYTQRLDDITQKLDSISHSIRLRLSQSKVKGFVIYHPSLSDYAQEFGVTQLCIEHQGKEPNPKQLSSLINRAKELNIKVVFVQKEFNSRLSSTIAKEIGARIFEINPLGKEPIKEIEYITDHLVSSQQE